MREIIPLCISVIPSYDPIKLEKVLSSYPIMFPPARRSSLHLSLAQWYGDFNDEYNFFLRDLVETESIRSRLHDVQSSSFLFSNHLNIVPFNAQYSSISVGICSNRHLLSAASLEICKSLVNRQFSNSTLRPVNSLVKNFVNRSLVDGIEPHVTLGFLKNSDSILIQKLLSLRFEAASVNFSITVYSSLDYFCMVPSDMMLKIF